jgi:cell cycle sensor histidine kinase DivJ
MCVAMLRPQAEAKEITIDDRVGPLAEAIVADSRAVQQILINLLSNAVKFTPAGGEIKISARLRDDLLDVTIADNGIGIAPADLEQLGKPFVQVQNDYTRNFEGTGLGLSLVKGLVELHEGAMEIESEQGKGTKVTFSLPIAGPSAKPARELLMKNDAKEIGRKDDDHENRRTA